LTDHYFREREIDLIEGSMKVLTIVQDWTNCR
jgi:hypothetical protein